MAFPLRGAAVTLRPATTDDVPALVAIRSTPEVRRWWRGGADLAAEVADDLVDPEMTVLVVESAGRVVGQIQWSGEKDPDYRHASIDVYLDPAVSGRGLGTDAVRTLARYLIDVHRYHRLTIDPATGNTAAVRCYTKVGFRPVGVMRQYERDADGAWHDALLMDLLAAELTGPA